jgi:polar amino acid transport system substrate-binding protein
MITRTPALVAGIGGLILAAVLSGCSSSTATSSTDASATASSTSAASAACTALQSTYSSLVGTTIKVATDPEIPSYSFIDQTAGDKVQGFNIDWTDAVLGCLGMKHTVLQTSFDGLIPALLAGRADTVNSNLVATTPRLKQVDFVTFQAQIEVFVRAKGNPESINSLADLCGKSIAVVPSSLEQTLAEEQSTKCTDAGKDAVTVSSYDDLAGGAQAVLTGRSDVFMEPDSFADQQVTANASKLESSDRIPEGDTYIGWALKKTNTALGDALLAASKALQADGTEAKLFAKWKQSTDYVHAAEYLTK